MQHDKEIIFKWADTSVENINGWMLLPDWLRLESAGEIDQVWKRKQHGCSERLRFVSYKGNDFITVYYTRLKLDSGSYDIREARRWTTSESLSELKRKFLL